MGGILIGKGTSKSGWCLVGMSEESHKACGYSPCSCTCHDDGFVEPPRIPIADTTRYVKAKRIDGDTQEIPLVPLPDEYPTKAPDNRSRAEKTKGV